MTWCDPRLPMRFWDKAYQDWISGCWVWDGAKKRNGYAQFRHDGRLVHVHRLAYAVLRSPVPEGMVLDHLCRNRACCNPAHLEVVTQGENVRRGTRLKTHCPAGHAYAGNNLYVTPDGGRRCRACRREGMRGAK